MISYKVYLDWPVPVPDLTFFEESHKLETGREIDYREDERGCHALVANAEWAKALAHYVAQHKKGGAQ